MASRSIPISALLFLGFSLAPVPGQAQAYATDRGAVQISGSARVSKFRDIGNDASTFVVELNPRVGYFVLPGLLLAANLTYAHYSSDGGTSAIYGVGPSLTYYLRHRQTRLNPYLTFRTLYTHEDFKPDNGPDGTENDWDWLGAGGAALYVARNVAITGEAFYTRGRTTINLGNGEQSNRSEEYGTQFGVAVYLF